MLVKMANCAGFACKNTKMPHCACFTRLLPPPPKFYLHESPPILEPPRNILNAGLVCQLSQERGGQGPDSLKFAKSALPQESTQEIGSVNFWGASVRGDPSVAAYETEAPYC